MIPTLSKNERREPSLANGDNKSMPSGLKPYVDPSHTSYDNYSTDALEYLDLRKQKLNKYMHPSKNARALVELGDIHLKKSDLKRARQSYINAIKLDPEMIEAYKKLLSVLIATKDTHAGDYYFQCLIEKTNNHVDYVNDYLMYKLSSYNNDNQIISKIHNDLKNLLHLNPDHSDILNNLGIHHILYDVDFEQAKTYLLRSLKSNEKNIHALNNLGICYQRQRNFKKATEYYNRALVISNKFEPVYENMASSLIDQGNLRGALQILQKGKRIGLQYSDIWEHNIGWLMMLLHDFKSAKEWYEDRIAIEPRNSLLFNNLGVCNENLNNVEAALENYRQSTEMYINSNASKDDKRFHNGLYNLMRVLQSKGDFPLLESVAKIFLQIDPDNIGASYYLGSSRIQLKKYDSAKILLENVIDRDPTIRNAYLDLSFLLDSITHEYDYAIQLLTPLVKNGARKDEAIINNLAFAHIKNGQLDEAERLLNSESFNTPITLATKGLLAYYKDSYKDGDKYYLQAMNSSAKRNKSDAEQAWKYEQAAYWYRKKQFYKAEKYIKIAASLKNDSYLYPDILILQKEIESAKHN